MRREGGGEVAGRSGEVEREEVVRGGGEEGWRWRRGRKFTKVARVSY